MNKKHRTFIAINLPGDVKKALAGYQKKWADVPAKWTDLDNLHITLVFLGDLTDIELGEVCLAVKEVAKNHQAFNLNLNKVAYGPTDKIPPRYIWAGGEESNEAILLKRDLDNALSEIVRFSLDEKTFNLHITLARINSMAWRAIEPEERTEVNEIIELPFTVESIEVMESELTRLGPRYTIIESHTLN
ncbi:MAG: RNA 2',3'-cyclic phosphodiesterase [Candidatus Staskawiczbacteria bacterium]|nr:RNA 2',3'-cyclic phosphodiesterase [Candidatus Staskawiczbacteria bacterium]